MSVERNYFHVVDYIVFVLMFLASMSIGVFFAFAGSGQKTTGEYLIGNRSMKLAPVALSLVVSVVSANTLLGAPAEVYSYGIMYWFMLIGLIPATILVAVFLVPLFYSLKLISVNEYLERRFQSKAVRYMGTLTLMLAQSLYVGTVIFGPATALETATGSEPWISILVVSITGTAYTAVGGIKAVVWTDFFQSFVMVVGMLAIIIIGIVEVGGASEVWRVNEEWGRLSIETGWDLTLRVTVWTNLFGYLAYWLGFYGVNQSQVQRFCGMSSASKGKIAILLNGPLFAIFQCLACGAGMVAFAYYTKKGCDPLAAEYISNSNQIIPHFVMDVMSYPGLPGLFLACLFSGSLSTFSSSIASMAAVVWEDILKDKYADIPEAKKTLITKCLVLFFGMASMGVAFMVLYVGGNLIQLSGSFVGASIGPLLGLFLLGMLVPFSNWIGAMAGILSSLTLTFWMMFGQTFSGLQRESLPTDISRCVESNQTSQLTTFLPLLTTELEEESLSGFDYFYSISFAWYSLMGMLTALLVGTLVSCITGCQGGDVYDIQQVNCENIGEEMTAYTNGEKKKMKY